MNDSSSTRTTVTTIPFDLTALQWNSIVTVGATVYVIALIGFCEAIVSRGLVSSAVSRKIVHVGAASWLIFWPIYVKLEDKCLWKLNVFIPAVKCVELFVKGAIVRDANDKDVKSMSRSGDPTELLYGPWQFTIIMIVVGLTLYGRPEACLIMGAVGVGDGIAPLLAGRHKYKTLGGAGIKSLEGSLGMIVGSTFGYYFYSWIVSAYPLLPLPQVILCAIVASVVEGLSPYNMDNVTIPVSMYLMYNLLA